MGDVTINMGDLSIDERELFEEFQRRNPNAVAIRQNGELRVAPARDAADGQIVTRKIIKNISDVRTIIGQFSGKEDVEEWLARVKRVIRTNPTLEREILDNISIHLTGIAWEFFTTIYQDNEPTTFDELATAFKNRFEILDNVHEAAFHACEQGTGSVLDYVQTFNKLAKKVYGDKIIDTPTEENDKRVHKIVLRKFLQGLKASIRYTVASKYYEIIGEAQKHAVREEKQNLILEQGKSSDITLTQVESWMRTTNENLQKVNELLTNKTEQPIQAFVGASSTNANNRRSDDRTCYNCNKPGHISRNCTEPRKLRQTQQTNTPITTQPNSDTRLPCEHCGRINHPSNLCSTWLQAQLKLSKAELAKLTQPTETKLPCEHCKRTNHTSDKCFYKTNETQQVKN